MAYFIRPAKVVAVVLVIYWGLLFASTHVPDQTLRKAPRVDDKTAHFVGYAFLSGLTGAAVLGLRRRRWTAALGVLAVMAAYGAFDELSQIPIAGRSADWSDWTADLRGAVCGLFAFLLARAVVVNFFFEPQGRHTDGRASVASVL